MKKMKEMKFHLATGLLILTNYLIFNVIPDLDFTGALSDEMYYVLQVLKDKFEKIKVSWLIISSNFGNTKKRF